MKYLYLILLLLLIKPSFGQTSKYYIGANGKVVPYKEMASSYIFVQKVDDSAYKVNQYNLGDTLFSTGYYKDASLRKPSGKFIFYQKMFSRNPVTGKDTIIMFIQQSGYFVEGKKSGLWITYISKGIKQSEYFYDNDHLNGPYIDHDTFNGGWKTGTMLNDEIDGTEYTYNADSLMITERKYKKGKITDEITHLEQAKPKYDFYAYLEKKLKPYKAQLVNNMFFVKYSVSKEGQITNPVIVKGLNPEIDTALISALKTAPLFLPAKYNGAAINIQSRNFLALFHPRNTSYSFYHDSFKFVKPQQIQNGYANAGMRSDGSMMVEYRVPIQ